MFRSRSVGNFLQGTVSAIAAKSSPVALSSVSSEGADATFWLSTADVASPHAISRVTPHATSQKGSWQSARKNSTALDEAANVARPMQGDLLHPSCFRRMVESVETIGLFLVDPEGFIQSWNPGAYAITGYTRSEVLGHALSEFVSPDGTQQYTRDEMFWKARHSDDERWEGSRYVRLKSGQWLALELTVAVLRDSADNVLGYTLTLAPEDTEYDASRELRESLILLRTIIEALPDPLFVKDTNGHILLINSAFAELFGLSPEQVLGKRDYELWPPVHAKQARDTDAAVLAGTVPTPYEFDREVMVNSQLRVLRTTKMPLLNDAHQICGVIGVMRDMTEARRVESERERILKQEQRARGQAEKLAQMLESIQLINDSAVRHDDSQILLKKVLGQLCELLPAHGAGVCLTVDRKSLLRFAEYGITDHDDSSNTLSIGQGLIGRVAKEGKTIAVDDRRQHEAPSLFLEDGYQLRAFLATPLQVEDKNIGVLYVGSTESGVFEPQDVHVVEVIGECLALAIDRWRLFEDLSAVNESMHHLSHRMIEVQEEERRHLSRELHDEIGQILTAVKLNLQNALVTQRKASLEEIMDDAATHINHAINEVRRISIGLRPPALDVLGLEAALQELIEQLPLKAGLDCTLAYRPRHRFSEDLEITLFRIAQEALTNTVRHAYASTIEVTVSLEKDEVVMSVKDDGIGFDYNAARRETEDGASLGLKSLEERTLLLQGHLDVKSTSKSGTCVRVRFPWKPPEADAESPSLIDPTPAIESNPVAEVLS